MFLFDDVVVVHPHGAMYRYGDVAIRPSVCTFRSYIRSLPASLSMPLSAFRATQYVCADCKIHHTGDCSNTKRLSSEKLDKARQYVHCNKSLRQRFKSRAPVAGSDDGGEHEGGTAIREKPKKKPAAIPPPPMPLLPSPFGFDDDVKTAFGLSLDVENPGLVVVYGSRGDGRTSG